MRQVWRRGCNAWVTGRQERVTDPAHAIGRGRAAAGYSPSMSHPRRRRRVAARPRGGDTMAMILIGVCGGIAAYKTCELVRMLVRGGHDVQVVQTPDSQRFVGPTTFAALSRRPVSSTAGPRCSRLGPPHANSSAAPRSRPVARSSHGEAATCATATARFAGTDGRRPGDEPADVGGRRNHRKISSLLAARGVEMVGTCEGRHRRRRGGGGADRRAGRDLRGDRRPAGKAARSLARRARARHRRRHARADRRRALRRQPVERAHGHRGRRGGGSPRGGREPDPGGGDGDAGCADAVVQADRPPSWSAPPSPPPPRPT